MKKNVLLIFLAFICLTSCNNNDDDLLEVNPPPSSNYNQGASVNRNFYGLILDTSGNAISNASVLIGTTTVQTNMSGLFVINNASVKENFAHIKVTKSGFIDGSRVLAPTTGDNRINIMLIPDVPTATVISGAPSQVSLANGTTVKFTGAFKDASGNPYTGNVQVGLYHLKPSDTYLSEIMPGSLLASNTAGEAKVLETFGMLHVELKGSAGQKLNLGTGSVSEISLLIDALQTATAPATIPLWSFDEATGIWKEEGSATKVGNKYVGNVSHFSWWNCDAPFAQCNLTVTVNNSANQPISNLTVGLFRPTQTYSTNGTTNATGQVSGIIPANEILTLKITDYCGNIIYTTSVGPFTSGSLNSLPTITLTPTAISTTTITGSLKSCSNTNVTNGLVKLKNAATTNFYNQILQTVTNGSFSFVTNICGTSQQFEIVGEDYTNLQTTGIIIFTATSPITNIGTILSCTAVNEFITYQIDGDPTRYIVTNIYNNLSGGGAIISTNGPVSTTGSSFTLSFNSGFTGVGTYNSNYSMGFTLGTGLTNFTNSTNTVQLIVSQFGPIGGYIDFTFNGTFTNTSGLHTVSGTGHVIRDN